jgi:hypothetical protein
VAKTTRRAEPPTEAEAPARPAADDAEDRATGLVHALMASQRVHLRWIIGVGVVLSIGLAVYFFFDIGPRSLVHAAVLGVATGGVFASTLSSSILGGTALSRRIIRRRAARGARRIEADHRMPAGTLEWVEKVFEPEPRGARGREVDELD